MTDTEASLADLQGLLRLEQLEVNLFRGESRDIGSPQVFGGQVLGQALAAASATIEGRVVHSLHAYFLRRGDFNAPIVYQVDRSRDGGSFSTRRVLAIQHGAQIFSMSCSFQVPETGLDHQIAMPQVPPPEELADTARVPEALLARLPEDRRRVLEKPRPFVFREVPREAVAEGPGGRASPSRRVWLKAVAPLPDDPALHRSLLAYVSDYNLLDTATIPHGYRYHYEQMPRKLVIASIDHAVWFHRDLRVDDWLLYDVYSPNASGSRGFARASVFARDGRLVASTAQEGLVRVARQQD